MLSATQRRISIGFLLLAGCLVTGAFLLQTRVQSAASPESPAMMPGQAAMRATIDPETGVLGVASGAGLVLSGEIQESLRRDTEGLKRVVHPDGSVSVNLQGRFQSASVARIEADGTLVICTEDADHAGAATVLPDAQKLEVQ